MNRNSKLKCKQKGLCERQCLQEIRLEREVVEQVDRFSNLPDHVIARILSSIQTEEAVRTSVLSSRWRYLWHDITSIYLRRGDTNHGKFANLVLDKCISTHFRVFELICGGSMDVSRVNKWISSILGYKIEELILSENATILESPELPIPRCILTCNTLVTLHLQSCFDIEVPDSVVCYPHLKFIKIKIIFSDHENAINRLFPRCPVLEHLHVEGYIDCDKLSLEIFVDSLKKLTLELTNETFEYAGNSCVFIYAPNLKYLDIRDDNALARYMGNLPSISDVHVNYEICSLGNLVPKHINRLFEFFQDIANTDVLTLYWHTIDILHEALIYKWPQFPYLMTLFLHMSGYSHWTCLSRLLESTPILEVLVLNLEGMNDSDGRETYLGVPYQWIPPDSVPNCLLGHIKIIALEWFGGNEDELQVVQYLLRNSLVLESLMIGFHPNPMTEETVEKLLMFPRASKACEVQVYQRICFETETKASGSQSMITLWGY